MEWKGNDLCDVVCGKSRLGCAQAASLKNQSEFGNVTPEGVRLPLNPINMLRYVERLQAMSADLECKRPEVLQRVIEEVSATIPKNMKAS